MFCSKEGQNILRIKNTETSETLSFKRFNQLLQIDAGTRSKIRKVSAYANAFSGFNNRTNGFSDEFHYGVESGTNLFKIN